MAKSFLKRIASPLYEKFWVAFNNRLPHIPAITGKFFPYDVHAKSFLIEQVDPSATQMADPGLPAPIHDFQRRHNKHSLQDYLESGKKDWLAMMKILGDGGFKLEDGMRVLDFGCSTSRILRYFKEDAQRAEFWGVDIHAGDIAWCKTHLSPPFKFATTTTLPHLPFEDNHFNLIYAGSLFTHIDDQADSWFLELRRVLASGGYLYVTVHDNLSIKLLETSYKTHPMAQAFATDPHYAEYVRKPYAMFTIDRSMGSQVFYDREWLLQELGRAFEIISVIDEAYAGFQTGILLKKR